VKVAVIDSGVHVGHPHLGRLAGGVEVGEDGGIGLDFVDRLGHGTAVAAAILEKAPDAEIFAVRVFRDRLVTTTRALLGAIDWAVDQGIGLINVSLGTVGEAHRNVMAAAVERAGRAGALIVSPAEHEGQPWLPGSLPGVIGVILDWQCPRHELRFVPGEGPPVRFAASGYPRPIPGVSPELNLKGVSFATANVTGFLARAIGESDREGERVRPPSTPAELLERLRG
jgi:subtilisin family serine protease